MTLIISLHNDNPPKIPRKSHVSSTIFSEKPIFGSLHTYFQYIQICEGALTLWRHSDVIWSLMVLILVSIMDRGGPYTLVANTGVSSIPYRKSRKGGCNDDPLRRTCYKKIPQEDVFFLKDLKLFPIRVKELFELIVLHKKQNNNKTNKQTNKQTNKTKQNKTKQNKTKQKQEQNKTRRVFALLKRIFLWNRNR